jgi:YVTN family beta-propeller protein
VAPPVAPSAASASRSPVATATGLPAAIEARIETGASAETVVDAFGSIWVTNHRPGTLTRIDPSTNAAVATVNVGGGHIGPAVEAGGKLWVMTVDAAQIVAIDPVTNTTVGSIDCGCDDEGGLTWVAGSLWFSAPDGMWWHINPETLKVMKKTKGTPLAASFVVGERWFGIDDRRVLYEFDPRTGAAIHSSDPLTGVGVGSLVATVVASTVWFSTHDGTVSRYDVESGRTSRVAKVDVSDLITDPYAPVLIAATEDAIYLRPTPELILHVDPRTGETVSRFEGMPPGEYQSYIAVAYGSLWVPQFSDGSVWRVALDGI